MFNNRKNNFILTFTHQSKQVRNSIMTSNTYTSLHFKKSYSQEHSKLNRFTRSNMKTCPDPLVNTIFTKDLAFVRSSAAAETSIITKLKSLLLNEAIIYTMLGPCEKAFKGLKSLDFFL